MHEQIREIMRQMLTFPYPQICRHAVAVKLCSALEDSGNIEVDANYHRFLKCLVDASTGDQEALELLPILKIK